MHKLREMHASTMNCPTQESKNSLAVSNAYWTTNKQSFYSATFYKHGRARRGPFPRAPMPLMTLFFRFLWCSEFTGDAG